MTDLLKEAANEEVINPFVSLKKILQEIDPKSIGELVTEIEINGIFAYDEFNRLPKCTLESGTKAQQAISLIRTFVHYDPNYIEARGMQEYEPSPLDDIPNPEWLRYHALDETFPSQYNYYGWLKSDLPKFSFIPNQPETNIVNVEHVSNVQLVIKNESTHDALPLDGIARMFTLDQGETDNIKLWRIFAKNAKKNGFEVAKTAGGKGSAQSQFDPVAVGEWLVSKGKMNQARVDRILNINLPKRNAHLKDF